MKMTTLPIGDAAVSGEYLFGQSCQFLNRYLSVALISFSVLLGGCNKTSTEVPARNGDQPAAENTLADEGDATSINQPPHIENPGFQTAATNHYFQLLLTASDADGDELSFSATGLPAGLELDATSGAIQGTPLEIGTFNITLTVSDGKDSREAAFDIEVAPPPNHPPVLSKQENQSSLIGESISLEIQARDPDDDPLVFTAANLPQGLDIDPDTGIISGTPTLAQIESVSVTAKDNQGASDTIQFEWRVQASDIPGLVGWWRFDEDGGDIALDSSGNGNDAAIVNGGRGEGVVGQALQAGGDKGGSVDGVLVIPSTPALRTAAEEITVMAWANRNAHQNVAVLAHDYPNTQALFFGFHEFEDGRSVFKWGVHNTNGDDAECWTGDASALNQWVHIAGTYDGRQAIIYVDGKRICSAQMTGPIALTEHPFSSSGFLNADGAGTESGVTDEIPGRIDDLRIYNRALSPEEIRLVYENPR